VEISQKKNTKKNKKKEKEEAREDNLESRRSMGIITDLLLG